MGGAFNLEAYLAALSSSAYCDFIKTDRYYVEAQGATLTANNCDLIGLSLDQAAWRRRTLSEQVTAEA